jgi:carboxyl-terminal processing protease
MMWRNLKTAVVAAAVVLLMGLAGLPSGGQEGEDVYKDVDRFVEVLQHIRAYYVDEADDEELIRAAVKRMLADLDPHTQFLEEEQYGNLRMGTKGTYTGVGMEVSTRRGYPVVISPMEGTPAQKAGLQTGDLLIAIDGRDTFGLLLQDAVRMLRGAKGSSVALTVRREGEPGHIEFVVVRDVIRIPSIPLCGVIEGDIGYVKVTRYSEQAAGELDECLDGLETEGIEGLVLDFRGNPGGLLMEAVRVCELFVPQGNLLVSTRGRLDSESIDYVSRSRHTRDGLPMIVMVDGGTASAAEIVAGAIQDWDLGLILGEPTFGKGSVQRVLSLNEGKALKLTTSYYFTPSGRCIHRGEVDGVNEEKGGPETGDEPVGSEPSGVSGDGEPVETQEFVTAGGRIVFGGGGITPDVIVSPPNLPGLVRRIQGRGLFFSFAVDYVGRHGEVNEAIVTAETLSAFKEYLLDEGFSFEEEEFESAAEAISLGIRVELARKLQGDAQAGLVAAEGDAQLVAAVRLLKKADDTEHLLELALEPCNGEE